MVLKSLPMMELEIIFAPLFMSCIKKGEAKNHFTPCNYQSFLTLLTTGGRVAMTVVQAASFTSLASNQYSGETASFNGSSIVPITAIPVAPSVLASLAVTLAYGRTQY